MNQGKMPAWFAYAGQLAEQYGFAYVDKMDTDAHIQHDKLFEFIDNYMPPAPYNQHRLIGEPITNSFNLKRRRQQVF